MTTVGERDPDTWPVGPVLEDQRIKLGLSLDQVAERAEISRATVRYYELGYRADNGSPIKKPRTQVLRSLAEALELNVDDVLTVARVTPARRKSNQEVAKEVARRSSHLADRIAQLDPRFRAAVETIVDEYLRVQGYVDNRAAEAQPGPAELRTGASVAGPEEPPMGGHAAEQKELPI